MDWLTVREAAVVYGCSVRTMRWYCAEGRVRGAVKQLRPLPYYLVPAKFEVLPPETVMGQRLWYARKEGEAWPYHGRRNG